VSSCILSPCVHDFIADRLLACTLANRIERCVFFSLAGQISAFVFRASRDYLLAASSFQSQKAPPALLIIRALDFLRALHLLASIYVVFARYFVHSSRTRSTAELARCEIQGFLALSFVSSRLLPCLPCAFIFANRLFDQSPSWLARRILFRVEVHHAAFYILKLF